MSENVLIKAAERFAERRQAAALESRFDGADYRTAIDTMADQPQEFVEFVSDIDQDVGNALAMTKSRGMESRIAGKEAEILDNDERVLPTAEFGVFYHNNNGLPLTPRLYVSFDMLSSQYDRLGPLFSNTNNPNYRLAAASAMSSWMALGKWAVETIDPRNVADPDTSTAALRAVTEFTDIAVDELDFESQDERIGEVMAVAAYRMAGGMAYAGLAKCIKGMREKYVEGNDSPPPVEAITLIQAMLQQFYYEQVSRRRHDITPTDFALASPLPRQDVERVFTLLGPVAKELIDQKRLPPTLNT